MHLPESPSLIERLILLKTHTLFHDPPHKSLLIDLAGREFSRLHRVEADNFRRDVLIGTRLDVGLSEEFKSIVQVADRLASSFDRWVLRVLEWPPGSYVSYSNLHNIFNPSIYTSIRPRTASPESLGNAVKSVVEKFNRILRSINELPGVDTVLLYNALYLLYEPLWYSEGLPPSLADTRVPTHTTFDHLYSAAALINLVISTGGKGRLDGFYVLVDFPSVQRFVGAARKAGDYWAGSYILSSVIWQTVERFSSKLGYDVLLMPVARFNPYALRSLLSRITNQDFYNTWCIDTSDIALDICRVFTRVYGLTSSDQLDMFFLEPVIPATASLILPPATSEETIKDEILDSFRNSWKYTAEFIIEQGFGKMEATRRISKSILSKIKDTVEVPPQGLRIFIVNFSKVHEEVEKCLVNMDLDSCRNITLFEGMDPNEARVRLNNISKLVKEYAKTRQELVLYDLVNILTWHLVTTRGVKLVIRGFGKRFNYTPRPFWVWSGGLEHEKVYKHIGPSIEARDWESCSLCGDEPVVVKFTKSIKVEGSRTMVEYSDDTRKWISEVLDREPLAEELHELKTIFKPGEALGPYCLLKRAAYYTLSAEKLKIFSTDNVALSRISRILAESTIGKEIYSEIEKYGGEEKRELLEYIFGLNIDKDLDLLASIYGETLDTFSTRIEKFLFEVCLDNSKKNVEVYNKFFEFARELYAIDTISKEFLDRLKDLGKAELARFCGFMYLPTYIAIIRGDADDVGRIITMDGGGQSAKLSEYLEVLKKSVLEYGRVIGDSRRVSEVLDNAFRFMRNLAEELGFEYGINSPTRQHSISLSLMLSALDDYKVVKNLDGVLVFSGGDDLLVLSPVHTSIKLVFNLRKKFVNANTDYYGFKVVEPGESLHIPVTSALLTGRSFSLRFVNILDIMGFETARVYELLEMKAKKSTWRIEATTSIKKDSLVVSDSRAEVEVILPLSLQPLGPKSILEIVEERLDELMMLLLVGALSRNLPEDVASEKLEVLHTNAKRGLARYLVKRNLRLCSSSRDLCSGIIERYLDVLNIERCLEGSTCKTLFEELVDLIRILRRYI